MDLPPRVEWRPIKPGEKVRDYCAAVDVCADWTGWKERRFAGDDVIAALEAAVAAKKSIERVPPAFSIDRIIGMVRDDAFACTFQTMGGYRAALIRELARYVPAGNASLTSGEAVPLKR